jgi:hypothetical protein
MANGRKQAKRNDPGVVRRDHARRRHRPSPRDAAVNGRLEALVLPALAGLGGEYRKLGLRQRVLTLPVLAAAVLTMIWQQVPSMAELVRLWAREPLLWLPEAIRVSEQGVNERLRCLPATLFEHLVTAVLPELAARSQQRQQRPASPAVGRAQRHFGRLWVVDAATLEALVRTVGALRGLDAPPLGGKLWGMLDLVSMLPAHLWTGNDPQQNEKAGCPEVLARTPKGTLLLFAMGCFAFPFFDDRTDAGGFFLTKLREKSAYTVVRTLGSGAGWRDTSIQLGVYRSNPCRHPLRLVEIRFQNTWYRYLTNVLDPAMLPTADVADLYRRADARRAAVPIESAFLTVKRLLGLAYLWTGAENGVQRQLWATWLLSAVLADLCDDLADHLLVPAERISQEMVFRGLSHYARARTNGDLRSPVKYLTTPENADLDVLKRLRTPRPTPLTIAIGA